MRRILRLNIQKLKEEIIRIKAEQLSEAHNIDYIVGYCSALPCIKALILEILGEKENETDDRKA